MNLDNWDKNVKKNESKKEIKYRQNIGEKDTRKIKDYFFYNISHTKYKVLLTDILYFESKGRQVKMVTVKENIFFMILSKRF